MQLDLDHNRLPGIQQPSPMSSFLRELLLVRLLVRNLVKDKTWPVISLSQASANCGLQAKSSPPPVCVNKVLLKHSHTHSFIVGVVIELTEIIWPKKTKIFTIWPFTRKFSMSRIVSADVLSHFSCVWLCGPLDCSPPGFSVHGILQARLLEWVAMPSSRGSSQARDQTWFRLHW